MKVSNNGVVFIAQREALVTVAYDDGKHLSWGFGHNDPGLKPGDKITIEEAFELLLEDVSKREPAVNAALRVELLQNEYDPILSLYYNKGTRPLDHVSAWMNYGNKGEAKAALLTYNRKDDGTFSDGLAKRREMEHMIFNYNDYGDLSKIKIFEGNPKIVPFREEPFPMEILNAA